MTRLILQWLISLPTVFSMTYCSITTLQFSDASTVLILLPGCVVLWICGAFVIIGLIVETDMELVCRRLNREQAGL